MRRLPLAAGTVALFAVAPLARPQNNPCPAPSSIPSYRSDPIAPSFTSILADPNTGFLYLPPADDSTFALPLPFPFTFYGVAKTQVNLCTNGYVDFVTPTGSTSASNRHPGDATVPNDCAMAWHDDLVVVNATSSVSFNVGFPYGPDTLTVQWTDVGNFVSGPTSSPPTPLTGWGSFTFQCVLYSSNHPTQPNTIEYRYDRTTAPPVMSPCQTNPTNGTITYATSATVGTDSASVSSATNVGHEATDRGAGNFVFPRCDLRLAPVTFTGGEQAQAATASLVAQEPYCSIVGLPGTVAVGPPCTAGACYDDDFSSRLDGTAIALPWKVNYFGRVMRTATMSANGYVQLGPGRWDPTVTSSNPPIFPPSTGDPDSVVAPFWDNLEGTAASGMFYRVQGSPGCRVAIFEWANFGAFSFPSADCASSGNISFQAKIFEGSAGALLASAPPCPYDLVVPGSGNDRIEFHYDHANFVAGSFTATIGIENHKGTIGVEGPPGIGNPSPPAGGMKVVFDLCDFGAVRYYGDATTNVPGTASTVELKTNGVPPIVGNPFALEVAGSNPSAVLTFLLLDLGGALPGLKTPVPCGGIPSPFGVLWVNLASSFLVVSPGCCATFPLPIPANPSLVGAGAFAQGVCISTSPFGIVFELTEGAKILIG